MVAGHGKLSGLLGYHEIVEVGLPRKFITKSDTVVIGTEAHHHATVEFRLTKRHRHLVIVVTNLGFLTPHRLPGLIDRFPGGTCYFKSVLEGQGVRGGLLTLMLETVTACLAV